MANFLGIFTARNLLGLSLALNPSLVLRVVYKSGKDWGPHGFSVEEQRGPSMANMSFGKEAQATQMTRLSAPSSSSFGQDVMDKVINFDKFKSQSPELELRNQLWTNNQQPSISVASGSPHPAPQRQLHQTLRCGSERPPNLQQMLMEIPRKAKEESRKKNNQVSCGTKAKDRGAVGNRNKSKKQKQKRNEKAKGRHMGTLQKQGINTPPE
ncbi:hypothetical protein ACFX15_019816 [Malus domestica]